MATDTREPHGKTKLITFVLKYPDGELKAAPVNALGIKEIVIDPAEIERRIAGDPDLRQRWNTGDWENNPSILLVFKDRPSILYCQKTGHPTRPMYDDLPPED